MSSFRYITDDEATLMYRDLSNFMSKFSETKRDWYKLHIRRQYYFDYFKNNHKLLMLIMVKPEMLIDAYNTLKDRDSRYYSNAEQLLKYFLNYLKNSRNLVKFLLEYSYSHSEAQLLTEINKKTTISYEYKSVYQYLFANVPLKYGNYLRKTFPNINEFTDQMFSYDSYNNRNNYYYRRYRESSGNVIRGYEPKNTKKKSTNSKNSTNSTTKSSKKGSNTSKKNKNNSKKKKIKNKSYYTKKYKDFIDSYPENTNFSECHSKAPDTYRKYQCNFFYNNCPDGWKSKHKGDISKCNCNGYSYKYYNNIFDCNPSLGIIPKESEKESEKESGTCQLKPKNKKEFAICFNKVYNKVKKIHQKNGKYYDELIKSTDEKTKSNLNTKIITNETFIKKYALELKSQFPQEDYAEYIDFAEFIEGYLNDALNFID